MPDDTASEVPISSRAVARMFGVATSTVVHWADEGKLPSFRTPGGHRRFRPADVAKLMEEGGAERAAS